MDLSVKSDVVAPPLDCIISDGNWQKFVSLLSVLLPDSQQFFNFGSVTPAPADRVKPWVRTDASGLDTGIWVYGQGFWTQKHQIPQGVTCIWTGLESDIDTLDGGEVGAIAALTGPFWAKVAALNAKMPLGCGTLPSGLVVNPLDTSGEEQHVLLANEVPKHTHFTVNADQSVPLKTLTNANYINVQSNFDGLGAPNSYFLSGTATAPTLGLTDSFGGHAGTGVTDAITNMPPYVGCFFIARTARTHRRIAG